MSERAKGVVRRAGLISLATLAAKIFSFLSVVFLARLLLPQEMGALDLAIVFATVLFPFFHLSIPLALGRLVPGAPDRRALIGSGLVLFAGVLTLFSLALYLFQGVVLDLYGHSLATLFLAALGVALGFSFFLLGNVLAQALEDFKAYAWAVGLQAFVFLVLLAADYFWGIPFLVRQSHATGALLAYALSYVVPVLLALWRYRSYLGSFSLLHARRVLDYALRKVWLVSSIAALALFYFRSSVFTSSAASAAASAANAGFFRALDYYAQLLLVPTAALNLVLFPLLVREARGAENLGSIVRALRYFLLVSTVFAFLLLVNSDLLVTVLLGAAYTATSAYAPLYLLAMVLQVLGSFLLLSLLTSDRYHGAWTRANLFSSLVLVAGGLWATPQFGLWGALAAYAASSLAGLAWAVVELRARMGVRFTALLKAVLFLALVFGAGVWLQAQSFHLLVKAALSLLGALLVLGLALAFRVLRKEDVALFRSTAASLWPRAP